MKVSLLINLIYLFVFIPINANVIEFKDEVKKKEAFEKLRGKNIDTFSYVNLSHAVNEWDNDNPVSIEACYKGFMVFQYKGKKPSWELLEYDCTDYLSQIYHEIKLGEHIAEEQGQTVEELSDTEIIKTFHEKLNELTLDDFLDFVDTSWSINSNKKPEIFANIYNPYDFEMYAKCNGLYRTIEKRNLFSFKLSTKQILLPSKNMVGMIDSIAVISVIHISDTDIIGSSEIPHYPKCGIWFRDSKNGMKFCSEQTSFSYELQSGEQIQSLTNLGIAFIALIKNDQGEEYYMLYNDHLTQKLIIPPASKFYDNVWIISGDGGFDYERSDFVSSMNGKECSIINLQDARVIKAPKGFIPISIGKISASFPNLNVALSDYIGRYPVFSVGKKFFLYDGSSFQEINRKYLKKII